MSDYCERHGKRCLTCETDRVIRKMDDQIALLNLIVDELCSDGRAGTCQRLAQRLLGKYKSFGRYKKWGIPKNFMDRICYEILDYGRETDR